MSAEAEEDSSTPAGDLNGIDVAAEEPNARASLPHHHGTFNEGRPSSVSAKQLLTDPYPDADGSQPQLTMVDQYPNGLVTVSDPVQHTEGMKKRFTMYRVAYDPPPPAPVANAAVASGGVGILSYATAVNRRYSDFSWLFDHLHKERPGAIVPPLPEKQQVSRFSDTFIEERRFQLEVFLRRVVCSPELSDTECLLVFLGGGEAEFKSAKKGKLGDASAAQSSDDYNDEARDDGQENKLMDRGKEMLNTRKGGIKKWIKEKRTTVQGTLVRSPDDVVFEEVTHFITALEAGLRRVESQASAMVKRDKDAAACLLEFGLGCDALALLEGEAGGEGCSGVQSQSSGIGQAFRLVGKASDAASAVCTDHHARELSRFAEPLRDHLKMVHAAKIALSKRNNRRVTYSTCLNAVDHKKANLRKLSITPGQEGKALGVEGSLSRAESAVAVARANYEEVSARVLREVDRFRRENATAMYATMVEFAREQRDHHERMNGAWNILVPLLEGGDVAEMLCNNDSFVESAAALRKGGGTRSSVSPSAMLGPSASSQVERVEAAAMPSYPPPPEPASDTGAGDPSPVLNGVVRYRQLPEG